MSAKPASFPRAIGLGKEGGAGAAHEINADRTDVAVSPLVVLRRQRTRCLAPEQQTHTGAASDLYASKAHRKAQEQARLADARVTDQHENEQIVICERRVAKLGSCRRELHVEGGRLSMVRRRASAVHISRHEKQRAMCSGGDGLCGAHSRPSCAPCGRTS